MSYVKVGVISALAGCFVAAAVSPAVAGTMQSYDPNSGFDPNDGDGYNYWHVEMGKRHKAVGRIDVYTGTTDLVYSGFGSGTVIADADGGESMWVLTAAHVIDTASDLIMYFPEDEAWSNEFGFWTRSTDYSAYFATEWYTPASWSGFEEDAFVGNDIALVKLSRDVSGVTPYHLVSKDWQPSFDDGGDEFEIVGFGTTGDGSTGATVVTGHRRAGVNRLDSAFGSILISDFDPDVASDGGIYESMRDSMDDFPEVMEYMIAPGDSGGPDLVDGNLIAGVHSWLMGAMDGVADASFTDWAGSTNVAAWVDWIEDVMANGSGASGTSTGTFLDPILTSTLGGVELHRSRYAEALADALLAEGLLTQTQYDNLVVGSAGFFLGTPTDDGSVESQALIPEPTTVSLLLMAGTPLMLRRRRHA